MPRTLRGPNDRPKKEISREEPLVPSVKIEKPEPVEEDEGKELEEE